MKVIKGPQACNFFTSSSPGRLATNFLSTGSSKFGFISSGIVSDVKRCKDAYGNASNAFCEVPCLDIAVKTLGGRGRFLFQPVRFDCWLCGTYGLENNCCTKFSFTKSFLHCKHKLLINAAL